MCVRVCAGACLVSTDSGCGGGRRGGADKGNVEIAFVILPPAGGWAKKKPEIAVRREKTKPKAVGLVYASTNQPVGRTCCAVLCFRSRLHALALLLSSLSSVPSLPYSYPPTNTPPPPPAAAQPLNQSHPPRPPRLLPFHSTAPPHPPPPPPQGAATPPAPTPGVAGTPLPPPAWAPPPALPSPARCPRRRRRRLLWCGWRPWCSLLGPRG